MVEIIPKSQEAQPLLTRVFFAFSLGALVVALGGFFLLLFLGGKNQQEAQRLQTLLATERTQEQIQLEREIFATRSRLEDFALIIAERTKPLESLVFLENVVHPEAFFLSAGFDVKGKSIQLSGKSSSFRALQEQLTILKEQGEEIKSSLGALKLAEEGGVDFQISVQFPGSPSTAPVQEQEQQKEEEL
jgi:hypothetical protein